MKKCFATLTVNPIFIHEVFLVKNAQLSNGCCFAGNFFSIKRNPSFLNDISVNGNKCFTSPRGNGKESERVEKGFACMALEEFCVDGRLPRQRHWQKFSRKMLRWRQRSFFRIFDHYEFQSWVNLKMFHSLILSVVSLGDASWILSGNDDDSAWRKPTVKHKVSRINARSSIAGRNYYGTEFLMEFHVRSCLISGYI